MKGIISFGRITSTHSSTGTISGEEETRRVHERQPLGKQLKKFHEIGFFEDGWLNDPEFSPIHYIKSRDGESE
ncbi:hypothetical protein JTE90_012745 [Oedothorax gibbosus]|uniref:Uncharacterized protein n=1 Tax=Oedothorax gibbosus TaxID=931172 RepID=A0AAV6W147_9ARAC|nr:hypothetical protein JTE90_012745 [Oedothorax gibbosus]